MTTQLLEEVLEEVDTYSANHNSLKPVYHALLTSEQRSFLSRLESFEAPYLEEKLLKENKFTNNEEYQEAFTEFKKFVGLFGLGYKDLAMSSPKVDNVWHQFILFTHQYASFCRENLGEFLHHIPKTSYTQSHNEDKLIGIRKFVRAYSDVFGAIPPIWEIKPRSFDLDGEGAECTTGCSGSQCSGSNCAGTMCNSD